MGRVERVEAEITGSGPDALSQHAFTRHGLADGKRVIFVLGHTEAPAVRLSMAKAMTGSGTFQDLISGQTVRFQLEGTRWEQTVGLSRWRMALLAER
jgi:hypothetical protein